LHVSFSGGLPAQCGMEEVSLPGPPPIYTDVYLE
jgi:hypothetical protein